MLQLARVAAIVALFSSMASAQYHGYYINTTELSGADFNRGTFTTLGFVSGPTTLTSAAGLAWRPSTRELWTYDNGGRAVGVINPVARTFTARSIASFPIDRAVDICWDATTDRMLILDVNNTTFLSTITSYSPASNSYATVATWLRSRGENPFQDIACDSAGNIWLLGGFPFGLYVLEPGRFTPRLFTPVLANACNLAIDRSAGTFYVHTGSNVSILSIIDPATGSLTPRADFLSCGDDFEVIEGSCNPRIESYGTACPGSGGYAPILSATGCYNASGFVHLGLSQAPSGSVALLLFGLTPSSFPLGNGCDLQIAPVFSSPQIALPLFGSGGAGRGFTAIGLSIPAGVVTTSVVTQAFVLDPGAAGGFTMTNGVRLD